LNCAQLSPSIAEKRIPASCGSLKRRSFRPSEKPIRVLLNLITSVREARFDDLYRLLSLCQEMHEEGSYKFIGLSLKKLEQFFQQKITDGNSLVLVWEHEEINGFFVADIVEYFFSEDRLAVDTLFFITKNMRKKSGAKRLLDSYIEWAKSFEIKEIALSTTNGVETKSLERVYEKLGFEKAGVMYKKEV